MYHIKNVEILENHQLRIIFGSGEKKIFDLNPYLEKGIFKELKNYDYLSLVKNQGYFIAWPNEQDLSSDTLYYEGQEEAQR